MNQLHLPTISEMYPLGTTLDIQMLLAVWLDEAEKVQENLTPELGSGDIIQYTYFVLNDHPFSDLINY
ncbi:MAG: hypothetical protein IH840_07945 [Candidatus Heimdallarchaeota archaeon]|nr:hypothetical protein [Candidatus Heimdallarchaeota archaeon]